MIKAVCTWGEGPDVLLVLEKKDTATDKRFILYEKPFMKEWKYGFVTCGSLDLTIKEAIQLAGDASRQVLKLEGEYIKQMGESKDGKA